MIPLRLSVKNFMCYRDDVPTLDFESLHVACLCGDNGHGKSALLDAITWALWGRARASQQHELIHQGQTDMEVTLDFQSREQVYRVIRKHTRRAGARQGATVLEFQAETGDGYRPVTANSVRETENKIVDTIQLDYETFINTAYLQQGKADLFTQNTASKRKEFLAEALGLSYYEMLEDRAKSRANELRDDIGNAMARIESRQSEIDRKPQYERDLADANASIAELTPMRDGQRADFESLQITSAELSLKRRELPDVQARLEYARNEAARLEREVQSLRGGLDEHTAIVERADEIDANFAALQSARAELEELNAAQSALGALRNRQSDLNGQIAVRRVELQGQRDRLSDDVRRLETETVRIPELEAELQALDARRARLPELEAAAQALADEAQAADAELARLNSALERKGELDSRKADLEAQVTLEAQRLGMQVDQIAARIADDLQPAAFRIPQIEEKLLVNDLAQQQLAKSERQLHALRGDERNAALRVQSLTQANERLRAEMEDTKRKFDLLEQGDTLCPLCKQPVGEDGAEHLRAEYETQGQAAKRLYQSNAAESRELDGKRERMASRIAEMERTQQTEGRRIQGENATLTRERDAAERAREQLEDAGPRLERLRARLDSQDYAHEQRRGVALMELELDALGYDANGRDAAQRQATDLHARASRLDVELAGERQGVQADGERLEREYASATDAGERLAQSRQSLDAASDALASDDYAHAAREELARTNTEMAALGYDAETHAATREKASALAHYEELSRRLLDAQERLEAERAALEDRTRSLEQRREEAQRHEMRAAQLAREVATLPDVEARLGETERRLRELESELRGLDRQRAIQEDRVAHCAALEAQTRADESSRRKLLDEKGIYDELAIAFSKNGIPALIIEDSIPQLQSDANRLLSRLTENRMSLKLELKEGRRVRGSDVRAEELDILIADEIGTRNYEMFSGGEAFRIDFALRIALSELLAARSGAPLPILFIDEGFGSQDASGQERMTEAIKSIEDDFQKIIVITHIEQMKEAFPVRIEVTKGDNGSTFTVV